MTYAKVWRRWLALRCLNPNSKGKPRLSSEIRKLRALWTQSFLKVWRNIWNVIPLRGVVLSRKVLMRLVPVKPPVKPANWRAVRVRWISAIFLENWLIVPPEIHQCANYFWSKVIPRGVVPNRGAIGAIKLFCRCEAKLSTLKKPVLTEFWVMRKSVLLLQLLEPVLVKMNSISKSYDITKSSLWPMPMLMVATYAPCCWPFSSVICPN